MLRFVVLATAILGISYASNCFFGIEELRCWCRENSGQTIFRFKHVKTDDGEWSIIYESANENCTVESIINVLPDKWVDKNSSHPNETTIVPPVDPEHQKMLDKGYQLIADSYYKIHTYGTYWDFARRTCIQEGAHLAIINSEKEAQYLGVLLRNATSLITHVESNDSAFIGFHDIFQEGEYLTIFGKPLEAAGFNIWAPNKPDNRGILPVGTSGNDCGGLFESGTLTDLGCDWHHAFICERENRDTSCDSYIDHSKGAFEGVEMARPPPEGTSPRTEAGLGYILYPEYGFYRYVTTPVIWENARIWCENEGAYLSTANTAMELQLIFEIYRKVTHSFIKDRWGNPCIFLGYHSYYESSVFVTIFNESIDYSNFWTSEPNNEFASDQYSGENCGTMMTMGKLNDIDCHFKMPFICEKPLK